MLLGRVTNGNFFRRVKSGSGRKSCRDIVGAVIIVDRVETTMKDNVMEIPRFLVQDVKSLQEKTDNGTRKQLYRLKVILAVSGGMATPYCLFGAKK